MNYLGNLSKKSDRAKRVYWAINDKVKLEDDLKRTFQNSVLENNEYIKLKDILLVIQQINDSLFRDKELVESEIDKKTTNKYGNLSSITIYEFNDKYIRLGFTTNYKKQKIKKLKINLNEIDKPEIFYIIKDEIDKLINLYKTYNYFNSLYMENIRAINSNLKISISLYGVSIYIPDISYINGFTSYISSNISMFSKSLEIKYSGYEDKYYTQGNNGLVECVKGKELKLLDSIYISTNDCPEYYKDEIRKKTRKKYKVKKI